MEHYEELNQALRRLIDKEIAKENIGTTRWNQLCSLASFVDYLTILNSETTTLHELQAAYEHPIIIKHNDYELQVPFSAELYHILVQFVNKAMEEI